MDIEHLRVINKTTEKMQQILKNWKMYSHSWQEQFENNWQKVATATQFYRLKG